MRCNDGHTIRSSSQKIFETPAGAGASSRHQSDFATLHVSTDKVGVCENRAASENDKSQVTCVFVEGMCFTECVFNEETNGARAV